MLNNVVIVGRLTKDPEVIETEKGNKRTFIIIAVPRPFKNVDGIYETDFIKCILWNSVAEHTCEYCKKGDVVGIKGRIQTNNFMSEEKMVYVTEVVAERVTFLSENREKTQSDETKNVDE
ncbi:MAG: single-stranded DNA-binding protein [Bacilli bacterium]|nr:single-stranded DNA-binding protein [Bacilli bacterium]